MKHTLTALLLFISIASAYSQTTNCTLLTATSTGIKITNKGMGATKYRVERKDYPDSITVSVAKNASLNLDLTWCDTLYVTPVTTYQCSCNEGRVCLYFNCHVLASNMDVKASRDGNVVTVIITPLTQQKSFRVHADWGDGDKAFDVPMGSHKIGVPFTYTFKVPE